jgi:uncharacterized protein YjbI with pentapeptide repeats/predicted heme/steroid binding protein
MEQLSRYLTNMANELQLKKLAQGVGTWNTWRKNNPDVSIDLSNVDLDQELSLRKAKLPKEHSILITSLVGIFATYLLTFMKFSDDQSLLDIVSTLLERGILFINPSISNEVLHAILSGSLFLVGKPILTILLSGAFTFTVIYPVVFRILSDSNINLSYANLSRANLNNSDLSCIDFNFSNLEEANLKSTNLFSSSFLAANLKHTDITGACIGGWNTDENTIFDGIKCKFLYERYDEYSNSFTGRRPYKSGVNFKRGECEKILQKKASLINFIFEDGMNWNAFAYSYNKVKVKYGHEQIAVDNIENRDDGALVINLKSAPGIDRLEVYSLLLNQYEMVVGVLKEQCKARLEDKDKQIDKLLNHQEKIFDKLPKLVSEMPRNTTIYNQQNSKWGGGFSGNGGIQSGGTFYDLSENIEYNSGQVEDLLDSLKNLSQGFPDKQNLEILEHLKDLQDELIHSEKRKPSRIKASLTALLAIAVGVRGAVAADFSSDVLELSSKLGVPIELSETFHE